MSISQTVRIVRAFSYFSHLANIAEDQNNIRQMRARTGPAGRRARACLTQTLAHARTAGISAADLRRFFETAQVSPVLTAHPTEVRRKSTIDREMEIAALLDRRERVQLTPEEAEAERRAVAPRGADAVEDQSVAPDQAHRARRGRQRPFVLRLHLPARGAAAALRAGGPAERGRQSARGELASFLKMGSWIGGDRDGNPFVTAGRDARHAEDCSRAGCCASIWRNCTSSAPNCRSPRIWPTSPRICARSPSARRTSRRTAAAEPYRLAVSGILRAADCDRGAAGGGNHARGGRRSRALRQMSRSSRPISTSSIAR